MKRLLSTLLFAAFALCASAQNNLATSGNLVLVSPYDQQVLHTFYPSFFWSFTYLGKDYPVEYNIKISELKEGQTYLDAIQYNPVLVFEQHLSSSTFMYPVSAFPLKEDKKYVWQVEANIIGREKYLSEIWMFQYKKEEKKDSIKEKSKELVQYAYLAKQVNAAPYLFNDKVNFRYLNETQDTLLNCSIRKAGSLEMVGISDKPVKVSSGINYYSFELPKSLAKANKKGADFILSVRNSRKENWVMKFTLIKKSKTNR